MPALQKSSGEAHMAGSTRGEETPIHDLSQCLEWCRSGARPRQAFKIGTEFERIAIDAQGRPLPYHGEVSIRTLLDRLADRHGWNRVLEAGQPIALERSGASVSLEPAGQFELSGAVLPTIDAFRDELAQHLVEVDDVARDLGIQFVYAGHNPITPLDQVPHMPKGRYGIMRAWMPRVGRWGLNMMHLTCTVQANLDYSSEAECMEMMRAGHLLTPVLIALFANSPYHAGKDTGYASFRGHLWSDVDPQRCDVRAFAFDPHATLQRYVDWLLDIPMYFVQEPGPDGALRYRGLDGVFTFRYFFQRGLDGRRPTMADWEVHVSTVFPDIRIKKWIEVRQADVVPELALPALPALCKGLLYDAAARREVMELLGDGDVRIDRDALREAACKDALTGVSGGLHVGELCKEALAIAHRGLDRLHRATGEDAQAGRSLDVLDAIVHGDQPAFWQVQRQRLQSGEGLRALVGM